MKTISLLLACAVPLCIVRGCIDPIPMEGEDIYGGAEPVHDHPAQPGV